MRRALTISALALSLLAARAQAYVTSAVLEYTCDDKAGFFLNGSPILPLSDYAPFDFKVLSTSDGTLPMELFNPYGDNLLAVENFDTEGYRMSISYRFTVHQSDGDPIVIWSDPSQAVMMQLHKEQPDPQGWNQIGFNDTAWKPASLATELQGPFDVLTGLRDPAFDSLVGTGFVPRLAHNFNMKCNTGDHNLYRSHFRFPDKQSKIQLLLKPSPAKTGDQLGVRMIPGPDSAEMSQFNVLTWLPNGLDFVSASEGAKWDPKLRRLSWSYGKKDLDVHYAVLPAASIIDAGGWGSAAKALGPMKQGKGSRKLNTPDALWNDGATVTAGHPGWFKLAPHNVDLRQWRPQILGVIFHSQLRLGGKDMGATREADAIRFNYSVTPGSPTPALRRDVEVSRMTTNEFWFDGYYDATEDRKWSWEDITNLSVKLEAAARGNVDKNLVAGMTMTIKYYVPSKVSPFFYAKVSDPRCDTLSLRAGVFRSGSPLVNSDPTELKVNVALCAPTAIPTAIPTPIPPAQLVLPTAEPTQVAHAPTVDLNGQNRFQLGCVNLNPQPFNYAGTFVGFCVKKDVDVTINVYSTITGKVVRQLKAGSFRPGDNTVFYNAQDDAGKLLTDGSYMFEVVAEKDGHKETRNGVFKYAKNKKPQ